LLRPMLGIDNFLSIPLETNISFSYNFIVLEAGHTVSNVPTKTVTIPASEQTIVTGRHRTITIPIPEKTVTVPVNVPPDLTPLMLPDDFNQSIKNQFCFILQNNGGNYSLSFGALDTNEISSIRQDNISDTVFINASESINESMWYNVTATLSENGMSAILHNSAGTLMENATTPTNVTSSNKMVIFVTNNADSAVVFKNLKVQTLNNATQPFEDNKKAADYDGMLTPYVSLIVVFVVILASVIYAEKKRRKTVKNKILPC
jgi:hypothetical protein